MPTPSFERGLWPGHTGSLDTCTSRTQLNSTPCCIHSMIHVFLCKECVDMRDMELSAYGATPATSYKELIGTCPKCKCVPRSFKKLLTDDLGDHNNTTTILLTALHDTYNHSHVLLPQPHPNASSPSVFETPATLVWRWRWLALVRVLRGPLRWRGPVLVVRRWRGMALRGGWRRPRMVF